MIAKAELGRAKEFLEAGIIQLPGIEEVAKRVEVPKDGPRQNHPNKWRDLLPKCQQETMRILSQIRKTNKPANRNWAKTKTLPNHGKMQGTFP